MSLIPRTIKIGALIAISAPLGLGLYFGAIESYAYITRSEGKAEIAANTVFLGICRKNQFDPKTFRGPVRPTPELDEKRDQYSFVWQRGPKETIYVNVSYLPFDFVSSISETLVAPQRETGSAKQKL